MTVLKRFFMHLSTGRFAARRAFPPAAIDHLQKIISAGESTHRAQLRLIIEPSLPWNELFSKSTPRGRAHTLFSLYRLWDTEENCGVLIYINLADKAVEIVADRGIARFVKPTEWTTVCNIMTSGFKQGAFETSAATGVVHVNALLSSTYPTVAGLETMNELPDRPIML